VWPALGSGPLVKIFSVILFTMVYCEARATDRQAPAAALLKGRPVPRRDRSDSRAEQHDELLRWVADLYYLQQQSQPEIARRLGVSNPTVSRLLAEARQRRIVEIHVQQTAAGGLPLERALAARYGLRAAYVAPLRLPEWAAASRVVGQLLGRVLPSLLSRGVVIGMSGGYAVAHAVAALPSVPDADITIVPLQGTWPQFDTRMQSEHICQTAASRLGARALSLPVPLMVQSAATRAALFDDPVMREVTTRWADVELAVVAVGIRPTLDPSLPTVMHQLPDTLREELNRLGVVGDLCSHMFDAHGRFIDHEVSHRTLNIPLDQLRRVPLVVAVGGGTPLLPSVHAALLTGIPHVLVTDELVAEGLLGLPPAG
jgi:DNA-binding transcriptional regulator LsrR (DeoR family)